jgi:hypothetical protein
LRSSRGIGTMPDHPSHHLAPHRTTSHRIVSHCPPLHPRCSIKSILLTIAALNRHATQERYEMTLPLFFTVHIPRNLCRRCSVGTFPIATTRRYLYELITGAVRCSESRCSVYQLRRLPNRMQDPPAEEEKDADKCSQRLRQVRKVFNYLVAREFDGYCAKRLTMS